MNKIALISLAVILTALVSPALAGVGDIRITPALPIMLSSPATFSVAVQTGSSHDPYIFLVMTSECHAGLSGNVVVSWSGGSVSFSALDFTSDSVNSDKIPPAADGYTVANGYTVASCKSHLGTSEPVFYAFAPFLASDLSKTPQTFTITFSSTNPKMLVYALGKSSNTVNEFDMRVPPTIPGFVIPELVPVLMALGSFAALGVYGFRRRKK